jgi:carbon monoxide dehydrogenase subunit G
VLKFFLAVLLALVLLPTLLWGFPGPWALTAILPAFIVAATLQHARGPRLAASEPRALRPGVILLGGLFGLLFGTASLVFMWAASAPSTISIERRAEIDAPPSDVWRTVVDFPNRSAWSTWMADADPKGFYNGPVVGATFTGMLALDRIQVPAELVITTHDPDRAFAWSIKPQGGAELQDILETVTLEPSGERRTRVTYTLAYEVPTTLARVGERIAVRGSVERLAEATVDRLRMRVLGLL